MEFMQLIINIRIFNYIFLQIDYNFAQIKFNVVVREMFSNVKEIHNQLTK